MFRIIAAITILGTVIWFFYALRSGMDKFNKSVGNLVSGAVDAFNKLKNPRSLDTSDIIKSFKVLSYFIVVICIIVLALTGFIPYLILGKSPAGFMLLIHVSISPVFAIGMTILTLLGAHSNVFNKTDQLGLNNFLNRKKDKAKAVENKTALKIYFWLLIILTPLIMGSIILSMYPAFGQYGQEYLLILHLVSTLLFLVFGIIHTFYLIKYLLPEIKND